MVKYSPLSFIILLSVNVSERLKNINLLYKRIVKTIKIFKYLYFFDTFLLTILYLVDTIII
jgi:hypothetical protein